MSLRIAAAPPAPAQVASPIDLRLWRGCGVAILAIYLASCLYAGGIYRTRGLDWTSAELYVLPLIALLTIAMWAWERGHGDTTSAPIGAPYGRDPTRRAATS